MQTWPKSDTKFTHRYIFLMILESPKSIDSAQIVYTRNAPPSSFSWVSIKKFKKTDFFPNYFSHEIFISVQGMYLFCSNNNAFQLANSSNILRRGIKLYKILKCTAMNVCNRNSFGYTRRNGYGNYKIIAHIFQWSTLVPLLLRLLLMQIIDSCLTCTC